MPTATASTVDLRALARAMSQIGAIVLFGLIPVAVVALVFIPTIHSPTFVYDFRGDLYRAGEAIVNGRDPYATGFLHHLAALARRGGTPTQTFAVPVYPAPALLASVPLALISLHAAGIVFTLLSVAALAAGLWLLGVRDWRCYGIAFLSWPVVHSLRLGQVNDFLVLGVAVTWRWRDRLWAPALAVAALLMAKVFLWPIWVWLLVTRRLRAAGLAVALAAAGSLLAWAVIGFDGFGGYPRMLSDLSAIEGAAGVSLISAGHALGLARMPSELAGWAVAIALLIAGWRRCGGTTARHEPRSEAVALSLAVIAALLASPLVWPHYLTLVFVPIALRSRRLSLLWAVPLLGYLAPVELTGGDFQRILPYLVVEAIVAFATLAPPSVGARATVRLRHGLLSTRFRSSTAAQRPNKGPEGPY